MVIHQIPGGGDTCNPGGTGQHVGDICLDREGGDYCGDGGNGVETRLNAGPGPGDDSYGGLGSFK